MNSNNPLVSAAELEALIKNWGSIPGKSVDKFFPLRSWYLFVIALIYAVWLLFGAESAAQHMTSNAFDADRMVRFLYFRGWFIVVLMIFGCYSYVKNWYPSIVLSCIFLVASVNLVFDMFNVYAAVIAHPSPRITLMLFLRMIALWFLYLGVKNSSRLPDVSDRLNLMLLLKRN